MLLARARPSGLVVGVVVLAFVAREALILRAGHALHASYGYDTSVYYAAADALLHGRIPYRDFVLLHPPFAMLVLTPAAALGHVISDHAGFDAAVIGFALLGSLNAGLVVLGALRWGMSRGAAVLGGLFYATWLGSMEAEFADRLEPLGNTCLLAGLLLIAPREGGRTRRNHLLAGVALGLAASTKIWFAAPALAIAIWLLVRRQRPEVLAYAGGLVAAFVVVDLPFLLLSRGAMFSRVITDQLGRQTAVPPIRRWWSIATVGRLPAVSNSTPLLVVASVLLLGVVVLAVLNRRVSFLGQLAVLNGAVLLASPAWFSFYADFVAVPLALSVAAAGDFVGPAWRRITAGRAVAALTVVGAVAAAVTVVAAGSAKLSTPWLRLSRFEAATRHDRCVMADSPAGLIELDALDRDLSRGCPNWVDVTGMTYFGRDRTVGRRSANPVWQHDLVRYLRSGRGAIVVRAAGDGLTPRSLRRLARGRIVLTAPDATVYQRPKVPTKG